MSWQTTLVQPVSGDRLTLVEVTCTWCPWSECLFDATTEDGRQRIAAARITHACAPPADSLERP